jgi:trk system potassium uptake protein TrkA
MTKRFAVIGLGLFGWEVAISLADMGAEVIAIDKNIEVLDKIKDRVLVAVQLNSTDQQSLEAQDLKNVDAAIVAIGSHFEESLLTVVALKQMGVPKVIARAGTHVRRKILEEMGCDIVVLPEEDMGRRIAKTLVSGMFLDRIEVGDQYSIVQVPAPLDFVGKKIIDCHLREDYNVNIVTIKSRVTERNIWGKETTREAIKAVPRPDDVILEGDILVLFGHDQDLDKLAKTFEKATNGA